MTIFLNHLCYTQVKVHTTSNLFEEQVCVFIISYTINQFSHSSHTRQIYVKHTWTIPSSKSVFHLFIYHFKKTALQPCNKESVKRQAVNCLQRMDSHSPLSDIQPPTRPPTRGATNCRQRSIQPLRVRCCWHPQLRGSREGMKRCALMRLWIVSHGDKLYYKSHSCFQPIQGHRKSPSSGQLITESGDLLADLLRRVEQWRWVAYHPNLAYQSCPTKWCRCRQSHDPSPDLKNRSTACMDAWDVGLHILGADPHYNLEACRGFATWLRCVSSSTAQLRRVGSRRYWNWSTLHALIHTDMRFFCVPVCRLWALLVSLNWCMKLEADLA